MIVQGDVTKVERLPEREGKPGLHSISIEGFSVLLGSDKPVPEQGDVIKASVRVQWREGKRPIHFLQSWRSALAVT